MILEPNEHVYWWKYDLGTAENHCAEKLLKLLLMFYVLDEYEIVGGHSDSRDYIRFKTRANKRTKTD